MTIALAVAIVLALALSPTAHAAPKGVVGWFGNFGEGQLGSGNGAGEFSTPHGIGINETGAGGVAPGTIYVADQSNRRIQVFDPTADFIAAWGFDVIGIDEVQRVTIEASGGTYTLSFGGHTTDPIAYNAEGSTVRSKLIALPSIGSGNVLASGFDCIDCFFDPRIHGSVTFVGALAGTDVAELTADSSKLTGPNQAGGPATVVFETLVEGKGGAFAGYERCTTATADICGSGGAVPTPAANGVLGEANLIAVDQTDGSVYVTDRVLRRVQKFDAHGTPLLVFGKGVNGTVAGSGAEVCTVASEHTCQTGALGTAGGEFGNLGLNGPSGNGIAVVPGGLPNSGNVVVADGGNRRVQEFTSSGNFVRAFGWDVIKSTSPDNDPGNEVQQVTVPATDGTFTLRFVSSTTPPIAYNAPASGPGSVQAALNGISSISSGGGSVSVTGGPGDATGSNPYVVTFDGGPRADTDVVELIANGRNLGAAVGKSVSCRGPSNAQTVNFQWLRNGTAIEGATASTYEIGAADLGAALQCQVFAFNPDDGAGITQASVPVMNVSPLPGTPRPTPPASLPDPTATFLPGQTRIVGSDGGYTLHCKTGSWGGAGVTFDYQWYRSGVQLSGNGADTADYIVQKADIASPTQFQCAVTGTNSSGAVTLMSGNTGGNASPADTGPDPENLPSMEPSQTQIADLVTIATTAVGSNFEVCTVAASCKAGVGPGFGGHGAAGQFFSSSPTSVAVDSTGAIYAVDDPFRVQKFVPQAGPPELSPEVFGSSEPPPVGTPNATNDDYAPLAVAIGPGDNVLVFKQFPGDSVTCFDGSASVGENRVQEITSDGLTLTDTHGVCAAMMGSNFGMAINPDTGDMYVSEQTQSVGRRANRIYILNQPTPPSLILDTPDPSATNAALNGTVNPNPIPSPYPNPPGTFWHIEYKLSSESDWTRFREPIGAGATSGDVPFRTTLTPLLPNSSYDVRLVANKGFNSFRAVSPPQTFTTDTAPPAIESARSSNVTASSADLHARIDPRGSDTTYYFEYGTTPEYGNVTPEVNIGTGHGATNVTQHIAGLADVTYHFRVVATNETGTVFSENETFLFHPGSCPNSLVRQQTGASYLPDCRAYELVSPEQAGNTVLTTFYGPTSGYAPNPSRLAYVGLFSPLPVGGDPPNGTTGDLYVSTRTPSGWVTKYIGLPAQQVFTMGGPPGPLSGGGVFGGGGFDMNGVQADPGLDKILLWDIGNLAVTPTGASNAPYLFNADGQLLARWPTNLAATPGGEQFNAGVHQIYGSPDLTHFVFASDVPFLSGGAPGDIYDNDTIAGTIEIINMDPAGVKFAGSPFELSADGSHILMSTTQIDPCSGQTECPPIPPGQLFMRVDGNTLDVTKGHDGKYAGMTRDGSKVYFLSDEQVTSDDEDTSTDLFLWQETTDAVTRVSASASGNGTGNTDDCNAVASWTSECGVVPISYYERECRSTGCSRGQKPTFFSGEFSDQLAGIGGQAGNDSFIAAESGDLYFLSPEKLAGSENGAEGLANLYLFRDGEVQFVASLDPDPVCRVDEAAIGGNTTYCAESPIARMQVSEDGDFAAFTATSRLTAYDNAGYEMMYRYHPSTDTILCVSCHPTGEPPTAPVNGSQNGLYMSNDGRTFFTTPDGLVPDDTNDVEDVYEYVDGRAQLITAGTGSVSEVLCSQCGAGRIRPGLIGVSADGIEVYFGTFDVLVPQDKNGGNLKIYSARTNGGFPFSAPPPACEAADECHGPSSGPPLALPDTTSTGLGDRGNVIPERHTRRGRCAKLSRKGVKAWRRAKALARRANRASDGGAANLGERVRKATRAARRSSRKAERCRKSVRQSAGSGKGAAK